MEILQCQECSEYTLDSKHCDQPTIPPRPARFSVEDKYAHLKREAKLEKRKQRGLL